MTTLDSQSESFAEGPQGPEKLRHKQFIDFINHANNSDHYSTVTRNFDLIGGQVLYLMLAQTSIGEFLVLPDEPLTGDFSHFPLAEGVNLEPLYANGQPNSVALTTTFAEDERDDGEEISWSRTVSLTFGYQYPGRSCASQELGVVLLSSGELGVYSMCAGYNDGFLFSDHRSGYSVEPGLIEEFMKNMKTAINAAQVESV